MLDERDGARRQARLVFLVGDRRHRDGRKLAGIRVFGCVRLGIGSVRLLPYHTLGISKYEGLGRAYLMPDSAAVEPEDIGRFAELLRAAGIACRVD